MLLSPQVQQGHQSIMLPPTQLQQIHQCLMLVASQLQQMDQCVMLCSACWALHGQKYAHLASPSSLSEASASL